MCKFYSQNIDVNFEWKKDNFKWKYIDFEWGNIDFEQENARCRGKPCNITNKYNSKNYLNIVLF